jgi:M6 family metalloprotease-like protein
LALAATGCLQTQPAGDGKARAASDNDAIASGALVRVDQPRNIRALALLVNFTDYRMSRSEAEFAAMLNQASGYNADGTNGSVNQFYSRQSNGRVNLTFEVASVDLPHPHAYYDNDFQRVPPWDGGQALVHDALAALQAKYPNGFTGLSMHPAENRLWSVDLMAAAPGGGGVNYGTDPAQNVGVKNNGVIAPVGVVSVTNYPVGQPIRNTTLIHELGHNLFEWTDYYSYATDSTTTNLGHYCLMGSGGNEYGPMPIDAGLRYQQGWINNVVEVSHTARTTYTVAANDPGTVYKYTNPKDPREYYLIEALRHGDYYVSIDGDGLPTDEGLAIWYVHEAYSSNWPFLRVKLVQADHRDDQSHPESGDHTALRGDMADLFDNVSNSFDAAGYPLFGWKDGSPMNLRIVDISAPGPTMSFTVVPPSDGAIAVPGRIEAEAFRTGGQNVGYSDLTSGNAGGAYRPAEDVDLEATTDAGGGYNVGWTQAGEWLRYDINVATAGLYDFTARVASGVAGTKTLNILVDGAPAGSISYTDASGWQSWKDVPLTGVSLTAGPHTVTVSMATASINLNYLQVSLPTQNRIALPGRIQAEAYNAGGEGAGYHDLSAGNAGGQYRTDNVDIETTADAGGGYNVGWTQAGEWLAYDVNVATAGAYRLTARLASAVAGTKSLAVSVDGAPVGTFSFTDASGWQSWKDVALTATLAAGPHTVRLTFNTGDFNVNYVDVQPSTSGAEMLANGSFANGLASWTPELQGTAAGSFISDLGAAKAVINATGNQPWEFQIWQQVALVAGKTYRLEFDMRAEAAPKNFKVVVEHNSDPWTKYHEQQYTVTQAAGTWQHFSIDFPASVSDNAVRVGFHFGANNVSDAWLDNVSLKAL